MQFSGNSLPPLGLGHFTVIDVPPLELVGLAARTGYATIGLRLYPAFPGAPFYEIPLGSPLMREMKARLEDDGITVYDIEFVTIDAGFEPASLRQMLASAAEVGAKRLNVCGDDADRGRLIARFRALCDLAAEVGMGVDLEIMPWRKVGTLAEAVAIVTEAGRPNGGVLIDALHLSRSGGSPSDLLALSPIIIQSAQLCDAPQVKPVGTEALIAEARGGRLLPSHGTLPLDAMLAALPDHTVLSVEVPNRGMPPEDHAKAVFAAATMVLSTHCQAAIRRVGSL